ncbi:MAG: hypothetical protein AAF226_05835, partial [Verrucomicrobiota bacterium]
MTVVLAGIAVVPAWGQNLADIAAREAAKRQAIVQNAQTLIASGSRALADRSYGEAMDYFRAAFESLPEGDAIVQTRRAAFQRYQTASLQYAQQMIDQARWDQAKQTLDDVLNFEAEEAVSPSQIDVRVKELRKRLDDPEYYNPALTPQHLDRVEKVKSRLILAQGYLDYGDYDRAERAYYDVLNIDPYNSAARRGLENVERHRMDYYSTSRNYTRSKMMREVAEGWESAVPLVVDPNKVIVGDGEVIIDGAARIENKPRNIMLPSIEFTGARLGDVLDYISDKSIELDVTETELSKRGINIFLDNNTSLGENLADRVLNISLKNVPLEAVLKYVTEQVGLKYRVDEFAVSVVPLSSVDDSALQVRKFTVPPGFISGDGGGGAAGAADPFAAPDPAQGVTSLKRVTAEEFLKENGIDFPPGASATFIKVTNTLLVRNTRENIDIIDSMVQQSREGAVKNVRLNVKIIEITENSDEQLGFDHWLGQFNVGPNPKVFAGGGTNGSNVIGTDFPFVAPGGAAVGLLPVTAGLRTGDVTSLNSV